MANAFFSALPGESDVESEVPAQAARDPGIADALAASDATRSARSFAPPPRSDGGAAAFGISSADGLPSAARVPGASGAPSWSSVPIMPREAVPPGAASAPAMPGVPSWLAVPDASGAVSAASPATQPFYFLDYAGSGWDTLAGSAAPPLSDFGALAAQATNLPTGVDLGTLPAPSAPAPAPAFGAGLPTPGSVPSFYFLESAPAGAGVGISQHVGQHPAFDVAAVRRDFPILSERVNGQQLAWLDNAATTQKPQAVIDRLAHFYAHENSNIHRAAHELAARATDAYEGARATVQRFLGASSANEIVFVRGATEAINLVAQSWGRQNILPGDEIVISHLEHHANIVPWQQLVREKGARLRVIPVDDSGQVLLEEYQKLLNERTKLVSVTQVSNALGTIVPVKTITDLARRVGARVLIDGAQAVSHMPVDVQALGADFYVFSGHKVFGPTGIGVLYGTAEVLESMPPWQGGGNMIQSVTFEHTTYQKPPARFEAGTGNIADAAGLGAALDYISRIGMDVIDRYEHDLLDYATDALQTVPGLRLIGTAREKASVLSFVLDGHDPVAVGSALNEDGIAVRAGHHCAEPILRRFGVNATVRPSLAFYNTCEEVDRLAAALHRLTGRSGRR
jgi:cysteine desulfurase / selenocysteine lyase